MLRMTPSEPAPKLRRAWLFALLSLAVVVVLVSLLPQDLFLSAPGTDVTGQFAAWRAFAAANIRAGHFPLWNPYTYSGQPFLGDFQSAELYPPNVIFLFLPLARAINLSFLLHLLILAWGVGYWCAKRGFHPTACALAGFTAALSGPVFPHLFGGHLSGICSMAWAPWILAFLEEAWRGPARRPALLAAAAVALQILAGHPQYVFYTAIAAGLNALVCTGTDATLRKRALPLTALVYVFAAALAAAQLWPGFAAEAESVRQGKVAFSFVSMLSLPPENLLTLVAPWFFGHLPVESYWGRGYLWELSVFIGISGLVLAALGLGDRERGPTARRDFVVVLLLFVLALGSHTPLLRVLYDYIPGFGSFRTLAKFSFPLILFVMLMLGAGADALIRGRIGNKLFAQIVLGVGLVTLTAGVYFVAVPEDLTFVRDFIINTHESYLGQAGFPAEPKIFTLGYDAGYSLQQAGLLAAIVAASLLGARHRSWLRWTPLVVLPLEMLGFAWGGLGTSHIADAVPDALTGYVAAHSDDYRVLDLNRNDNGFLLGAPDIWGNDPTVLRRYAEFIKFTQQENPDQASQYVTFKYLPTIYSLLRFRFAFIETNKGYQLVDNPGALPHALLVQNYQTLPNRDAIFAALAKPDFDPAKTVLLESEPALRPKAGEAAGTVTLADSTSDSLTFVADTPTPAILLITDLYSRDWRVRPLSGDVQTHYDILPADYILRAIPLDAGHHHLIVEYDPPSFREGLAVSAIAWLIWLGLWWWPRRKTQLS